MSGQERARAPGKSSESRKTATNIKDPLYAHEAGEMFPRWSCLSCENLNLLMELSVDEVQLKFVDVLELKKHETCVKEASLLDYFVGGFWWAKEMSFTCQQISFFMALLQKLLDNIKDKHMPFADNFKEFTRMLLASRQSPPSAGATFNPLFDVDQIKSITDYFSSSLFQHYRLYEFVFTHLRDEMLLGTEPSLGSVRGAFCQVNCKSIPAKRQKNVARGLNVELKDLETFIKNRNVEVCSADFIAPMEDGTPADDLHLTAPSTATPPDQHSSWNIQAGLHTEGGERL